MATTGTHGENIVEAGDAFNPPADINKATAFAKLVGNAKSGTAAQRGALTASEKWEGMLWSDTDTPCLWEYQSGAFVLRNKPEFANATARASAIPSPAAGWRVYRTDLGSDEGYNGTAWVPITPGLNLVKPTGVTNATLAGSTIVVAGQTSFSVNGVFNGLFDKYMLVMDPTLSANGNLSMRMRLNGSDDALTNYDSALAGAASGAFSSVDSRGANSAFISGTAVMLAIEIEIMRPAKATQTIAIGRYHATQNPQTAPLTGVSGFTHRLATAYDGFTILSGAQITGEMNIYGFNKG